MLTFPRRALLQGAGVMAAVALMPSAVVAREPRVLIIDDGDGAEEIVARCTKRWIQRVHAVEVDIVSCPVEALDRIGHRRHALLMLEPSLAGDDLPGWKQRIRHIDPDLLILFNGCRSPELPTAAYEGEATLFLERPWSRRALESTLAPILPLHALPAPEAV